MSNRSIVSSAELFAGAREVAIEHADQCYLLVEGPDGQLLLLDLPASTVMSGAPLPRIDGVRRGESCADAAFIRKCRSPRGCCAISIRNRSRGKSGEGFGDPD